MGFRFKSSSTIFLRFLKNRLPLIYRTCRAKLRARLDEQASNPVPTPQDDLVLNRCHIELIELMQQWSILQGKVLPEISLSDIPFNDPDLLAKYSILLPSSLSSQLFHSLKSSPPPSDKPDNSPLDIDTVRRLDGMRQVEVKLRHGQLADLLTAIRFGVKKAAWAVKDKDDHARGQHAVTRAQQAISTLQENLRGLVSSYNRVYGLLSCIDPAIQDTPFKLLQPSDLKASSAITGTRALGADKLSWIWSCARPSGVTAEDWELEGQADFGFPCILDTNYGFS